MTDVMSGAPWLKWVNVQVAHAPLCTPVDISMLAYQGLQDIAA